MTQAYKLKNVRYQGNDRKILLQNENGPCPLLAAANALLLRGATHLPSACIRSGCASLEEVVNMLAEKAMTYKQGSASATATTTTSTSDSSGEDKTMNDNDNTTNKQESFDDSSVHKALHDILEILPKLQYGMDVNPKFTNGPTGMEFTTELTTFDLLNVRLVHGWLLDPQSEEEYRLIGSKTYNELVEFVIHGNEASAELHKLEQQLKNLESCGDDDWVDIGVPADTTPDDTTANSNTGNDQNQTANGKDDEQGTPPPPPPPPLPTQTKRQPVRELKATFREKQEDLSKKATLGSLINNFLEHTGHQLTQYGLSILYEDLAENELGVFFRNNHFSTITKHEGLLYLLVTDFGYANVPNVVWEKLDVIDGDTEYVDSSFSHPAPHAELSAEHQSNASGYNNLDPEQLIAQRGQSEADYQLALQLSGMNSDAAGGSEGNANTNTANSIATATNVDEQEGKLMAAATEASLRAYNGVDDGLAAQKHHDKATTQEDRDHLLAMQMQADMEQQDMQLAQQMQQTEWAEQRQARQNAATTAAAPKASNCVIS